MPPRGAKKRKSDSRPLKADDDKQPSEDNKKVVIKKDTRKRVKGKLSALLELPIDILFEIFGHLKPYDLLKVARVSKEFRKLLMKKSSISVWRAALDQVPGLPPRPSEMSEPAWVNLAFDPHCHFCFKSNVRTVEWGWRLRICNKCAKDKLRHITFPVLLDDEYIAHYEDNLGDFPVEGFVISRDSKHRPPYAQVLIEDVEKMKTKYAACTDDVARRAFIIARRQVLSEIQTHADLCAEWARSQADDRSYELYLLRVERCEAIVEKLVALGYGADIASICLPDSLANHDLVKKPQKLTERIWAKIQPTIIKFMDEMRAKRLEREHVELVHQRKLSAVAAYRGYIAGHHPFTDVIPSGLDFCAFPPVKEILEQSSEVEVDESSFSDALSLIPDFIIEWRKSLDKHLMRVVNGKHEDSTIEEFNDFGEFIGNLDEETSSTTENGTDNTANSAPPDNTQLHLATTVFTCNKCNKTWQDSQEIAYDSDDDVIFGALRLVSLFYPAVKGHACLMRKRDSSSSWFYDHEEDTVVPMEEPARKLDSTEVVRRQWSPHPLYMSKKLTECAEAIVKKAGLDSKTTTVNDMDELKCWFACLKCAERCEEDIQIRGETGEYKMPAFTWRMALEHFAWDHRGFGTSAWTVIDAGEIDAAVEAFESNARSSRNSSDSSDDSMDDPLDDAPPSESMESTTWFCVHCRDTPAEAAPTSLATITTHLKEEHDLEEPEENRDYYKDFAAVPPHSPKRQVVLSLDRKEVKEAKPMYVGMPFSFKFGYGGGNVDYDSEDDVVEPSDYDSDGFSEDLYMFY